MAKKVIEIDADKLQKLSDLANEKANEEKLIEIRSSIKRYVLQLHL